MAGHTDASSEGAGSWWRFKEGAGLDDHPAERFPFFSPILALEYYGPACHGSPTRKDAPICGRNFPPGLWYMDGGTPSLAMRFRTVCSGWAGLAPIVSSNVPPGRVEYLEFEVDNRKGDTAFLARVRQIHPDWPGEASIRIEDVFAPAVEIGVGFLSVQWDA